jgi:hypothetical protein
MMVIRTMEPMTIPIIAPVSMLVVYAVIDAPSECGT